MKGEIPDCQDIYKLSINRRRILYSGAACIAVISNGSAFARPINPVVKTKAGKIRGRSVGNVDLFLGIPYGASTEGRRFMPPQPVAPWRGIRDALDYGNQAPQNGSGVEGNASASTSPLRDWNNPRPSSEDCLVLNVFAPAARERGGSPVMVFFHGGGFSSGSSARRYAEGTRLAGRKNVVVVTVNHRLNAFGYLYLGHLIPELADSGNAGNLDMVLSLQWVQDNIARFGGNPDSVTIFGESGGGGKVACLMTMPSAVGLFHRAIQQSGPGMRMLDKARGEDNAAKLLSALKLSPSQAGQLRTMPASAIIAALGPSGANLRPVVDGRSLPRHPYDPDAPSISRNVPLLIGVNKDETALLSGELRDPQLYNLTWKQLPARLAADAPMIDAGKVIARLRELEPAAKPSDIYFTATTWTQLRRETIMVAERKAALKAAPTFMYLLTWETPVLGGRLKSSHTLELPFVFDTVGNSAAMMGAGPVQDRLAETMSAAWARFARSGDPGWPAYGPESRATMVFDAVSSLVNDPDSAQRQLFG